MENLCLAWEEFIVGKKKKPDVVSFSANLMDNIVELHEELVNGIYRHGGYKSFYINDPKRRHIHKASVRDRLLHHAVYRILYPFFDRTFVPDSFSCRNDKGVHKAINRFRGLAYRASKNHHRTCWVLKCDIQKFFASIDHEILLSTLRKSIPDQEVVSLLKNIIESFHTESKPGVGLPLGNLTSQLFANVYLNTLDHWVKHKLKARCYVRYADDFVFLSDDKSWLESIIPKVQNFLASDLHLVLHPNKIFLKTCASGVDFLGWIHFLDHRVLRTKTKQRILKRMKQSPSDEVVQSYLGLLRHGNATKLREEIIIQKWLWNDDRKEK